MQAGQINTIVCINILFQFAGNICSYYLYHIQVEFCANFFTIHTK